LIRLNPFSPEKCLGVVLVIRNGGVPGGVYLGGDPGGVKDSSCVVSSVSVDLSLHDGRFCVPLDVLERRSVCVSFEDGESGVSRGGMLQVGDMQRQTLGSFRCRTSSGGRVLSTTTSTGINLQTGEESPRELMDHSFRLCWSLSKREGTWLLMLGSRVPISENVGLFIPRNVE